MIRIYAPLFIFALCGSIATYGQEASVTSTQHTPKPRFLISGSIETGGETVAEVLYTNGKTVSLPAGQGGSIAAGLQLGFGKTEKYLLRGSVGIKYITAGAENAHIRLTRIPIHLTASIMAAKRLRIGAGLAAHNGIKFKTDGIGEDFTLKNAAGPIFEIAYYGIGISYTAMKYKDQQGETYSANSFGIIFSGVFPVKR